MTRCGRPAPLRSPGTRTYGRGRERSRRTERPFGVAAVLIAASDAELSVITHRYEHILGAGATVAGPKTVVERGTTRIEIVPASAASDVLPDEPAPASS